ncbi:MAG: FAD-dependent oxidoreductase [Kangiellaceae bacterium]|nr:FAD-dependent oxidoreductase [Kangiellaceae bacterium]
MNNQSRSEKKCLSYDVAVIGAGIAGLVAAFELLKQGRRVAIIDSLPRNKIGGQARIAFGGMALIGTPQQKRLCIKDSPEIAYRDWLSFAEFSDNDYWQKAWARHYVERSRADVYDYLIKLGIKFLPAVNWVERGLYRPGNSVPRYHILWGASRSIIDRLKAAIFSFNNQNLQLLTEHKVVEFYKQNGEVKGCISKDLQGNEVTIKADNTIIACGGFSGDLEQVKANWPVDWGSPPKNLPNGSLTSCDGQLHSKVSELGASLTNLKNMWNYAAGVPHHDAQFENEGLSLIPCKSAIWTDHYGQRIGPESLVSGFDTSELCKQISLRKLPHTWQILNMRIAKKEFAISGCDFNPNIRDRNWLGLIKDTFLGSSSLINSMIRFNPHFVSAASLKELISKMANINDGYNIDARLLTRQLREYDSMVAKGEKYWNDDQIRRIIQLRNWPSEKLRTCYPKPIEKDAMLIAIKLNLISRKCLGGMQTNLNSQVLDQSNNPIGGLFAIGEAAGFGGGGMCGKRSLEGTFLSGCILNAHQAARYLAKNT